MATDSTELTFVRCPSCRSLVPAVSTRCRMCGAGLDASGEGDDLDRDQKKSGRVRQRTMSQAQSELNAAVSKIRASEGVSIPEAPGGATPPPAHAAVSEAPRAAAPASDPIEQSLEDPLSAYIEEVDEPEQSKTLEKPVPQPVAEAANERNGHGTAKAPEVLGAAKPAEKSVPPAQIISNRGATPDRAPEADRSADAPEQRQHTDDNQQSQRVIVESGMRRPGKPSGLSFSRSKDEARPQSAAQAQPVPERHAQPKPAAAAHAEKHEKHERTEKAEDVHFHREERRERSQPTPPPVQQSRQREPERREPEKREPDRREPDRREPERRDPARERSTHAANRPQSEGVKRSENLGGRLFGWLVSYADPDGLAIELREGKFFVTASSLKATDLIIEDSSISTPHALVSVNVDSGLQVQDLMSDRGVFVRRRGDDTYRREADVVGVEHGDWVRFGDVEYLVSLIAHVGIK